MSGMRLPGYLVSHGCILLSTHHDSLSMPFTIPRRILRGPCKTLRNKPPQSKLLLLTERQLPQFCQLTAFSRRHRRMGS